METNNLLWNAEFEDFKKGYCHQGDLYTCLVCGISFEEGVVFPVEERFVTAEKMASIHVEQAHGGMFNYLIGLDKKFTGLTDAQTDVLQCFYKQLSDFETSKELKILSSTVRNYRFKFREKEKQSKVFTAMMDLYHEKSGKKMNMGLVEPHDTSKMVDERFAITEKETQDILSRYFDGAGKLIDFPHKEKRKIILLNEMAKNFRPGRMYSEKEINEILGRIYDDYVTIRRYLIEYGYLERNQECSEYWVKD